MHNCGWFCRSDIDEVRSQADFILRYDCNVGPSTSFASGMVFIEEVYIYSQGGIGWDRSRHSIVAIELGAGLTEVFSLIAGVRPSSSDNYLILMSDAGNACGFDVLQGRDFEMISGRQRHQQVCTACWYIGDMPLVSVCICDSAIDVRLLWCRSVLAACTGAGSWWHFADDAAHSFWLWATAEVEEGGPAPTTNGGADDVMKPIAAPA